MMKHKIKKEKFDQNQAIEQFEKYQETGDGRIINLSLNQVGYSKNYDEGWERIFGSKRKENEERCFIKDEEKKD